MAKLLVTDLDVRGKRVLVRADLNVPLGDGEITDDRRIQESLATVRWLVENGARTILMSHLGRPKGERNDDYSLAPVADRLTQALRKEIRLAPDCVGDSVQSMLPGLGDGDVLLLENVRFHAAETAKDPDSDEFIAFSKQLASLGEIYVNDAFGTAHRKHASTFGVTRHIETCAMGLLMKKELDYLGGALIEPRRPFVAIMGGAKVSGKIDVIKNLLPRVDTLLIGGGMSYTIFKQMGHEIGKSLLEESSLEAAGRLVEQAKELGPQRLVLPLDIVTTAEFKDGAETMTCPADAIPADREGIDIGPETRQIFADTIRAAKTVIWNGPMGVFEIPSFAHGTEAVARALADATENGATTIVGGGDSAAALSKFDLDEKVSHVSTGGGASLDFLAGKTFQGVEALTEG
jgi:phosphoglycerate kinase